MSAPKIDAVVESDPRLDRASFQVALAMTCRECGAVAGNACTADGLVHSVRQGDARPYAATALSTSKDATE